MRGLGPRGALLSLLPSPLGTPVPASQAGPPSLSARPPPPPPPHQHLSHTTKVCSGSCTQARGRGPVKQVVQGRASGTGHRGPQATFVRRSIVPT